MVEDEDYDPWDQAEVFVQAHKDFVKNNKIDLD